MTGYNNKNNQADRDQGYRELRHALHEMKRMVAYMPDNTTKQRLLNLQSFSIFHKAHQYGIKIDVDHFVNNHDHKGNNMLHIAAAYNRSSTIDYLVQYYNFDINAVNNKGRTALHYAALNQQNAASQALVDHQADTKCVDNLGYTAFDYAWARMMLPIFEPVSVLNQFYDSKASTQAQHADNSGLNSTKRPDSPGDNDSSLEDNTPLEQSFNQPEDDEHNPLQRGYSGQTEDDNSPDDISYTTDNDDDRQVVEIPEPRYTPGGYLDPNDTIAFSENESPYKEWLDRLSAQGSSVSPQDPQFRASSCLDQLGIHNSPVELDSPKTGQTITPT